MHIHFLIDHDTGRPHCERHSVDPTECIEVIHRAVDRRPARDGAWMIEGQTRIGRYLRVIYREVEADESIMVITAYDLTENAKRAYRGRRRRHP